MLYLVAKLFSLLNIFSHAENKTQKCLPQKAASVGHTHTATRRLCLPIMLAGGGLMSTNTYEVNNNPVDFYWDFNRNMAISNCSNYGNDILSAWYNGKDIVYKHSTPDVMSFRAAPNNITAPEQVGTLIAPNPANSFLKISGIQSGTKYLITDISGRTVLQGQLSTEQKIDTQSLPNGQYYIRILEDGKFIKNYSFTKKINL